LPLRDEVKRRWEPSWVKAGLDADSSPRVYWRAPLPSAAAIQMWVRYSDCSPSMRGSRTVKATHSPSGERAVPPTDRNCMERAGDHRSSPGVSASWADAGTIDATRSPNSRRTQRAK
jgi:hypothetical protein